MSNDMECLTNSLIAFYEHIDQTTLFYSPDDLRVAVNACRSIRPCLEGAGIRSVILPEYTVRVLAVEGAVDPQSGEWRPRMNERGECYTYEQAFQVEYSWHAGRERCALIGQYEDEYIELVLSPKEFLSDDEGGDTDV